MYRGEARRGWAHMAAPAGRGRSLPVNEPSRASAA